MSIVQFYISRQDEAEKLAFASAYHVKYPKELWDGEKFPVWLPLNSCDSVELIKTLYANS